MATLARRGLPALVALVLALVGAGSALAAVVLHQQWWGLLLGLLAAGVGTLAVGAGWSRRVPWAAGWLLVVGVATSRRAEGDYLVPADVPGYALLIASLAMAVAAMVTLPGRRSGDDPGDPARRT